MSRIAQRLAIYLNVMAANGTLLCIHREPAQLRLLEKFMGTSWSRLRMVMRVFGSLCPDTSMRSCSSTTPWSLDGTTIASEIKQVRPTIPIVMLTEHMDLPDAALESVDALVAKDDGPHFLLATVHFVLNIKPAQPNERKVGRQELARVRRASRSRQVPSEEPAKRS